MNCTARIVRERKVFGRPSQGGPAHAILVYCPIFGELTLTGQQAADVLRRLQERDQGDREATGQSQPS